VEQHLRVVSGGELTGRRLRRATAAVFENYARYWVELFRGTSSDDALEARFVCGGFEHVEAALDAGRGVILAVPHVGNWDMAGTWVAGRLRARGRRLSAVVERVEPPALFEWFVERRRALGMDVIAHDGADAAGDVARVLRGGGVVCLVADRDLTGDGVGVELFGRPTTMPGGPALLALRTGAVLLPAGARFIGPQGNGARILAPVTIERTGRLRDDLTTITQELAHRFEELIAADPEQWLVMQPIWAEPVAVEGSRR
jgi:KDO2-lipid IV(A) lauroyltransferase